MISESRLFLSDDDESGIFECGIEILYYRTCQQDMPINRSKTCWWIDKKTLSMTTVNDLICTDCQKVQTKRGSLGKPTSSDKYSGSVNRVHQFAVNFAVKFAVTQRRFRLLSGIYLFIDDEKDVSNSSAKWN